MIQRTLKPSEYPFNIREMFYRRFTVEVPSIALKSIAEIRERGIYAIGNDEHDHTKYAHAPVETSLTLNQCFELWRAGHRVTVLKISEMLDMFNIITLHLQHWISYLNRGIQISDAPFEELLSLDQFADKIYPHAQEARAKHNIHYFKSTMSGLGFNLNPATQLGGQNFFMGLSDLGGNGGRVPLHNVDMQEEREGFADEITRLGGRLSQDMREQERSNLFRPVEFGRSTTELSK